MHALSMSSFSTLVQVCSCTVMVGSVVSCLMPPALTPVDVETAPKTVMTKIRSCKVYGIVYKVANACAINAGWAKNLADPRSRMAIQQFITIVTALLTKNAVATVSGTYPDAVDAAPSDTLVPVMPRPGELVVTDKVLTTVAALATGIATAATNAAASK